MATAVQPPNVHQSTLHVLTRSCVYSIQQSAAMALGRLANYSDDLAETLVQNEVLPQLVYSLSEQNRFYKKAATFCLRAVAKHSPQLAQVSFDSLPNSPDQHDKTNLCKSCSCPAGRCSCVHGQSI